MDISVDKLKEALSILSNAVSKKNTDKILTKMLELKTNNGILYGYTYDQVNFLRVKIDNVSEELNATVDFNTFSSLIKNISSDTVSIKLTEKGIAIKSNTLKVTLPILIDGSGLKVTGISANWKGINIPSTFNKIDVSKLKDYMSIIKSFIVEDFKIECYRNIYFNTDYILATDTNHIVKITDSFFDKDVLLKYNTVDFLSKLSEIEYAIDDKTLFVKSENFNYMALLQNKDDYQYEDLSNLFSMKFDHTIEIDGYDYSNALSNSKLFTYNAVGLQFNSEGLFFRLASNDFSYKLSDEPYNGKDDCIYTINKDIAPKLLLTKDKLTINYGDPKIINVVTDNISAIYSVG